MFSKIVVGKDGSDTAAAAVALATELARQSGATLHVVNAYRIPTAAIAVAHAGAAAATDDALGVAAVKDDSDELLGGVAEATQGVPVQTHSVAGEPADAVINVAKGVEADLIVVGSKGMQGARRLIGSVPNSIAHRAPCHVLIAKTK